MKTKQRPNCRHHQDSGVSILIIAVSMIFILGMAGLGIDLASLYVGRNQAQRAADAAALAGAQILAKDCTSAAGGTISQACQTLARQQAIAMGNQNTIAGISPNIQGSDVTFLSVSSNDPQIRVVAARDTAHGNPMPTFFVKIFGIDQANVSATAVAEAYNPTGGPQSTSAKCLKPWLMPNCDWGHLYTGAYAVGPQNPACIDANNKLHPQFIMAPPGTTQLTPALSEPVLPQSDTQGELLTVKSSDPSLASAPSQFYPVFLPNNPGTAPSCPSCALQPGGGGPQAGSLYSENISCCNQTPITCGSQTLQPITGNMVGPTANGIDCLIHQQGGSGQDIFSTTPNTSAGTPWTITGGQDNPYNLAGQTITSSDSMVTVPLYDGHTLCPGGSCPSQVDTTVLGYLQLFIQGEQHGNVSAYVMSVVGCPSSGSTTSGSGGPSTGPVAASGGTPIAVRLIHE